MKSRQHSTSLWQEEKQKLLPPLEHSITTKVCVVGAGIAGLSIAYQLLKRGIEVVVVDKEENFQRETSLSSAHLSNALDDRYFNIEFYHSPEGALVGNRSHAKAIDLIETICEEEGIDCDFKRVPGYLIPGEEHDRDYLKKELNAAVRAGVEDLHIIPSIPGLKQLNRPSLVFSNQAQFHPLKYLLGLRKAIEKMKGKIYGECFVEDYEEKEGVVLRLRNGHKIICQDLVFATNAPANNHYARHTKEATYRTYIIGLKIEKHSFPEILLWDTTDPYHYVRVQKEKDYDVLIVGGEDHRTGQMPEDNPYQNLHQWVKKTLAIEAPILFQWSGQILETLDGLAYIGKKENSKHIYEVSGDSGHGLTHGTIAGLIIPDLIEEKPNRWATVYDARRLAPKALKDFVLENAQGSMSQINWLTPGEISKPEDLLPNQGALMRKGCFKVTVYKDADGKIHEHSAVCPHLKAPVQWNDLEKTWDCPWHGSRFDTQGKVINSPALEDLKPVKK